MARNLRSRAAQRDLSILLDRLSKAARLIVALNALHASPCSSAPVHERPSNIPAYVIPV
jgi:hypothetical protein